MTEAKRIYLRELAEQIDRRMNTVRLWEREKVLPENLLPHRDEKGWRYWTPAQARSMKAWMKREGRAPGAGLRNVTPSVEKTKEMLSKLRSPRPERRTRTQ